MTVVRPLPGAALALALLAATANAGPPDAPTPPKKVSYARDILPLFQQHCMGCHQPAKAGGGFVMTTHPELLKKGDSDEPGIVPGKPEASHVLAQITPKKGKAEMPRGQPPLAAKEIDLVRRWIAEGAV